MKCIECPWYDANEISTDRNDCLAYDEFGFCMYGKKYPNETEIEKCEPTIEDWDEYYNA